MPVRAIVVCPTTFERQCLVRAQRDGILPDTVRIDVCGPGSEAVKAWARGCANDDHPVILAGVAGATRAQTGAGAPLAAGSAWIVTEVRDGDGGTWCPTVPAPPAPTPACVITSTAHVVVTSAAKRELGARLGCDLIDLESVTLARVAEERGWSWAVVRGVSDDVRCELPATIGAWVDGRGRARPFRVAAALVRRLRMVADVRLLHHHGRQAMRAVAAMIAGMLVEIRAVGMAPARNAPPEMPPPAMLEET